MKDLEVLEYLFNSMGLAYEKLGKAIEKGNVEETAMIKKLILDISARAAEEMK
jgi:hypothetical protein